ncbi:MULTISPECIES: NAD(P)/FAD-dependent oxidoreductase [unclassified Kitasatospora]|uniref:NAD(P)/FAD-dependent oxidoreductase n=1 Tax=unclassified Kitasatospora TaxID=2633591 RepID=UPI00070B2A96|nr:MULTISPECIES: FAD-dependent oxidoreductase [unclassified Kitasatospora]KQV05774.1 nitrite reductase [Kitasatospora sp. Root107]KRB62579.1 nitrite reductase [Kitasatospora sp. Root187]
MTATDSRVVVVGGGMAGHRLAQQLALHGGREVLLLAEEEHRPYNRVLLAEVLAGRYAPEIAELAALPPTVERRRVRVVRIDREQRRVLCDDGAELGYGDLVLATGSNPVLPPLRGLYDDSRSGPGRHELPAGVFAFRTMADCADIDGYLPKVRQAVVVGGGLLGVSAARALAARGIPVVLAHQGEHLLERHLDPEAAELLRTHLTELGVEVHTECRARSVLTTDRAVTGVELADGFRLDADLLVIAVGVRPRTGLAQAAGLAVRRGVLVDDLLRTDDPHIHALGDCAEHDGTVYGLAGPAFEQADVLAQVLTGRPAVYRGSRLLTRLTLAATPDRGPLDIAAFGVTSPSPEDRVVRLADAGRGSYRKVIVRRDETGDRLVGGVLLGDLDTVGQLAHTWEGDEALSAHPLHLLTTRSTSPGGTS